MNSNQEIALQLTLKAIEKMYMPAPSESSGTKDINEKFSDYVVNFYNNIYKKLDRNSYT